MIVLRALWVRRHVHPLSSLPAWGELDLAVGNFTYTVVIKPEFPLSEDPERAQSLMVELPYSRSGRQGKWADRKQ
ncbi:hypothetical protein [Streptomyces sp. NPDC059957]|uniref:hypothetical protein n=1 Tax=Streptomyces sp. NPDC059957 TaxID=3347016 RepID=UPI0036522F96